MLPRRVKIDLLPFFLGAGWLPTGDGDSESGRSRGSGRSHPHPLGKVGNHRRGKFALGGHLVVFVAEGLDQQAAIGIARCDGGARFAPFADRLAAVEPKSPLQVFGSCRVALVTVLNEDRPDAGFKEINAGGTQLSAAFRDRRICRDSKDHEKANIRQCAGHNGAKTRKPSSCR